MPISKPQQLSLFFNKLADNNRTEIYRHLSLNDLCLFALTSKSALNDVRKNNSLLQLTLHLAAFAAPVSYDQKVKSRLAVMRYLKLSPELLFQTGITKDPAGREVGGSIYKIFLGAGDAWARKKVHEEIIPLIPNGEAIAKQQYNEQFPRHADQRLSKEEKLYDDRNIAQIALIEADLKEIVAALKEDSCTGYKPTKQKTKDALKKLHTHLAPNEKEVIRSGLYSPPKIMEMLLQVYEDHYDLFSVEQLRVYSLLVVGKAQKTATAVDAQCYKKGKIKTVENYEPDRTSTYFTSTGAPEALGEEFFIDIEHGAWLSFLRKFDVHAYFETLNQAKESATWTPHTAIKTQTKSLKK